MSETTQLKIPSSRELNEQFYGTQENAEAEAARIEAEAAAEQSSLRYGEFRQPLSAEAKIDLDDDTVNTIHLDQYEAPVATPSREVLLRNTIENMEDEPLRRYFAELTAAQVNVRTGHRHDA